MPTGAMLRRSSRRVELDAVAITTPPGPRYAIAATASRRGSTSCWKSRRPRRSAKSTIWRGAPPSAGVSLFATWHAQHQSGRASPRPTARGQAHRGWTSFGTRMSTNGIPARSGSGRRAASACSIRASTPFRSPTTIFPQHPVRERGGTVTFRDGGGHADRGRDRLRQRGQRGPPALQPRLAAERGRGMDDPRHDRGGNDVELRDGGAQLLVDGKSARAERKANIRRSTGVSPTRRRSSERGRQRAAADGRRLPADGQPPRSRLNPLSGSRAGENPARGWLHPCRGRRGRTPAWSRALSRAGERLRPVKRASPAAVQT